MPCCATCTRLAPANGMIWRATGEAGSSGRALACPDPRACGDGAERQDRWTLPGCGRASPTSRCTVTSYRCSSTPTCSSETITRLLYRLDQQGTGAGRQRALFTSGASTPAFITGLARATLSGYEPARPRPPTARAAPRAGPDGDPGHAGAGDRRPGPGHRCGAERRVGRCRGRGRRGLLAAADGEGDPRDDPRRDGQHGSDQRSHGAAAPGPGLSTP